MTAPELVQVARQRRLGDLDAVAGEQLGQLGLGPDGLSLEQLGDPLVPGRLGERDHGCSSSQVSRAFCACSRFSASSQTTECGPSMTSAAISSPR